LNQPPVIIPIQNIFYTNKQNKAKYKNKTFSEKYVTVIVVLSGYKLTNVYDLLTLKLRQFYAILKLRGFSAYDLVI